MIDQVGDGGVIILAAYPKTGSTWLRQLTGSIVALEQGAGTAIPSFLKTFPADAPFHTIWGKKRRLVRTHYHPLHPVVVQSKIALSGLISIHRHPLDVLLSALNYEYVRNRGGAFLNDVPKPVERILADGEMEHYLDSFITGDGLSVYANMSGRFSMFQPLWQTAAGSLPSLDLRYEEMTASPMDSIRTIAAFFGRPHDSADLERIFAAVDAATRQDGKFFWSRRAYNYRRLLPPSMIRSFTERYAPVIESLGYGEEAYS